MPTVTKTTAASWLTWNGGTGATVDGLVNASSGAGPFSYSSTGLTLASLKIDATASSPLTAASPSGGSSTILTSNSVLPFSHAFYLSASKVFNLTLNLAFDRNVTHSVFIDSGATLTACCAATVAGQNTIQKRGAGTWQTSTNDLGGGNQQNSNIGAWQLYEGVLGTGASATAQALGTATIGFFGGTLQVRFSRTFANTITVNADGGTITTNSGATATMSNAASGSGILTVTGAGNVAWNNNISCPLNVTGLLTMGTGFDITGATLSGAGGTIAMQSDWGNAISADAPTFTGTVTGLFQFTRSGTQTFGGVVGSGAACDIVPGTTCTFTGTSLGRINAINSTTVKITGSFNAASSETYLINTNPRLEFYASGTFAPSLAIRVGLPSNPTPAGVIALNTGASLSSNIIEHSTSDAAILTGDDSSSCTYAGTINAQPTAPNPLKIRTKGTLVFSGSAVGVGASRGVSLNSEPLYTGTIKVTGLGFTTASPVTLSQGKLHLNRAGTITIGGSTGLTVAGGATVGCSSTGTYAAQLSGAMVLQANSTLKFGAAP